MSLYTIIEIVSGVATIIAIAGVVLNNQRRRECFYLWLVSNGLSLAVHAFCGLWAMTARDAVFLILAVHGLYSWKTKEATKGTESTKMKKLRDMNEPELCEIMKKVAESVALYVEENPFFVLVFDEPGLCQYVNSGNRNDWIKILRLVADILERDEDIPRKTQVINY